jgi:hypothetical protein
VSFSGFRCTEPLCWHPDIRPQFGVRDRECGSAMSSGDAADSRWIIKEMVLDAPGACWKEQRYIGARLLTTRGIGPTSARGGLVIDDVKFLVIAVKGQEQVSLSVTAGVASA